MTDSREVLTRPAPPPDLTLTYGPDPSHLIDVRLPPGGSGPLVVVLHGGFWRSAYDRTHTGPLAHALAAAGYLVAVPEYRRTGQEGGGWPGTFTDVAAALDAVPSLLSSPPPIVVGHSAGGHLALWAASRAEARLRGVVSLAGCADLVLCGELGLDDGAASSLMGGSPAELPERYASADPAQRPVPSCPVILLHGTSDDRVPIGVSRSYAARTGAPLRELPGVGHFALIDPLSAAWPAVLECLDSVIASRS
jgi:acetyl esterase/lipase